MAAVETRPMTEEERKSRKKRSIAIAASLVGLVVLFYLVTVFKLGANILSRPL